MVIVIVLLIGLALMISSFYVAAMWRILGGRDLRPGLARLWSSLGFMAGVGIAGAAAVQAYVQSSHPFIVNTSWVTLDNEIPKIKIPASICVNYVLSKRASCPGRVWIYLTPVNQYVGGGVGIDYIDYSNMKPEENVKRKFCYDVDADEANQVKRGLNRVDIMTEHTCPTWWGLGGDRYPTYWHKGPRLDIR